MSTHSRARAVERGEVERAGFAAALARAGERHGTTPWSLEHWIGTLDAALAQLRETAHNDDTPRHAHVEMANIAIAALWGWWGWSVELARVGGTSAETNPTEQILARLDANAAWIETVAPLAGTAATGALVLAYHRLLNETTAAQREPYTIPRLSAAAYRMSRRAIRTWRAMAPDTGNAQGAPAAIACAIDTDTGVYTAPAPTTGADLRAWAASRALTVHSTGVVTQYGAYEARGLL